MLVIAFPTLALGWLLEHELHGSAELRLDGARVSNQKTFVELNWQGFECTLVTAIAALTGQERMAPHEHQSGLRNPGTRKEHDC